MKAAKIGDEILINAELLKSGKTVSFLTADVIHKESGDLLAKGSHTKYMGRSGTPPVAQVEGDKTPVISETSSPSQL